jgi:hypothetical protein
MPIPWVAKTSDEKKRHPPFRRFAKEWATTLYAHQAAVGLISQRGMQQSCQRFWALGEELLTTFVLAELR